VALLFALQPLPRALVDVVRQAASKEMAQQKDDQRSIKKHLTLISCLHLICLCAAGVVSAEAQPHAAADSGAVGIIAHVQRCDCHHHQRSPARSSAGW
jgi:hypothetical protein